MSEPILSRPCATPHSAPLAWLRACPEPGHGAGAPASPAPPSAADHEHRGMWLTDFPPPPGFDGYERGVWDGESYYERACTEEEVALLEARDAADRAEERAEAERCRTEWFARLERQSGRAVN